MRFKDYYLKKQKKIIAFPGIKVENNASKMALIFSKIYEERIIPPALSSLFLILPKAELHAHLRGSIPLRFLREIMLVHGASEKEIAEKIIIPNRFDNLNQFIQAYEKLTINCKEKENLTLATYLVCRKAAEDNVKYLELRISLVEDNLSSQDMLNSIRRGIEISQQELNNNDFKQIVKLIISAKRHGKTGDSLEKIKKKMMKEVKLAVDLYYSQPDHLIVGFDICGDETNHPIYLYKDVIQYAKENNLPITIHAGETYFSGNLTGNESVEHSVQLNANRIGHGIRLNNNKLIELIKKKNIVVEVAPTSNVAIKNADWKNHPIRHFLDKGIKVALCTDDAGLLKTKQTKEFERLYKHGLITSWFQIKRLILNSIEGAFIADEEKKKIYNEFQQELKAIENNPFYQKIIERYL